MCFTVKLLFLICSVSPLHSARILGIASSPCYSHQVVFRTLWLELLTRGHHLTVLTTQPMKNNNDLTNFTEIDLSATTRSWKNLNLIKTIKKGAFNAIKEALNIANQLSEDQLHNPDVQKLIKHNNETFDLLIVETLLPAMLAFSVRFNCPIIAVSSMDAPLRYFDIIGNPTHPVLNPYFLLPFAEELTFLERIISSVFMMVIRFVYFYLVYPAQETIVRKYFENNYPTLTDITQNVSLLFINTNLVVHQIRPLLPSVITIGGGFHLNSSQKMSEDLKTILDKAQHGFIYLSLGSNIESNDLPQSGIDTMKEVFHELPYTVLWKYRNKNQEEQTDQIIMKEWVSQDAVLRHRNIKLFITQGGLQSLDEAIHYRVPILGVPLLGDQHQNIKTIVKKELGLELDLLNLDKQSFKKAILELINNSKYRENINKWADLSLDQPMTGRRKAIWWIEYVLRHKGAKHLKYPAVDLPIYQYFLLDVVAFCVTAFLLSIYGLMILFRLIQKLMKRLIVKLKHKVE